MTSPYGLSCIMIYCCRLVLAAATHMFSASMYFLLFQGNLTVNLLVLKSHSTVSRNMSIVILSSQWISLSNIPKLSYPFKKFKSSCSLRVSSVVKSCVSISSLTSFGTIWLAMTTSMLCLKHAGIAPLIVTPKMVGSKIISNSEM
ncbi:unnamed protein product [Meganyctiphanes norvegica]|uniref:Secreted protein n=1 Tax=Meganyctiphanes norvegica TaxID=48144 RepID=A0AAV2RDQ2_MEGNR